MLEILSALQSVGNIQATNFSNGTITTTLQQLGYLITERAVIKEQATDVF